MFRKIYKKKRFSVRCDISAAVVKRSTSETDIKMWFCVRGWRWSTVLVTSITTPSSV